MKEKPTKSAIQRAAKWWADQIRNGAPLDNGDQSETRAMTFLLAMMLQQKEQESRDPSDADHFEVALQEVLTEEEPWVFGVDYNPDHILSVAAERAGIELGGSTLPRKTNMWIEGDKVRVSCGYAAQPVEI